MDANADFTTMLPHAAPSEDSSRLLLFGVRRMAAGGLSDAHVAAAFLMHFGKSYRRPLILLRALMAELARAAARPIVIAPCCCPRMTEGEAQLLAAIAGAVREPRAAHGVLSDLIATQDSLGALTSAQALAQSFADLGRPLR
jgi:hypothetical protein